MNNKKTILHIINYFGRGGAEIMLMSVIKELKEYNNIVVTLYDKNRFEGALPFDKYFCLKLRSLFFLPVSVLRLRRIIKAEKVDIVHTHLFWPTFTARFATPRHIPLVTTIHTSIAFTKDYKKWYIRSLDRVSYKFRRSTIIAVAKGALKQYFEVLKLKAFKTHVLYTFVDTNIFKGTGHAVDKKDPVFKVMTIGTLKYPKNHEYLIAAFAQLQQEDMELHIYGEGPLRPQLESAIKQTGARVILKGEIKELQNIFNQYDLYVMASLFEGFSLSVLEAMAMQMPLLLSDIPSFREQCAETATYFGLDDAGDLVRKIKNLAADKNLLDKMGSAAKQRAIDNFTLEQHMAGLREIYTEALNQRS